MVQSIDASKKIITEKAKAQSAWTAENSLDSIRLNRDCGFVWKQLPKPGEHFLRVAFERVLG